MTHTNGRSRFTFFQGLVFGGVAGATLAILFAPRSGEETRDLIAQKSDELRDRVSETAAETRAQINGLAYRLRAGAEDLAEEARASAAALQEHSLEYVQGTKERLERTAEAAQRAARETWKEAA